MLEDILPKDFLYKVLQCSVISAENFRCEVRTNIDSENDFRKWLKDFEIVTNSSWILRDSVSKEKSRFRFSRNYVCKYSPYRKKKEGLKNKNCSASLSVRMKRNSQFIRYRDPFVREGYFTIIKIDFQHSHKINVSEACNWHPSSKETKQIFIDLFNSDKSLENPQHPDYVPNIIVHHLSNTRWKSCELRNENSVPLYITSFETEELSEMDDKLSQMREKLMQDYAEESTLSQEKEHTEVSVLTQGEELQMDILNEEESEKKEELLNLKRELQQAYKQVNTLSREKQELQRKLRAADVTQSIFQDPNKLLYYTGLNSLKDFHLVLSLLSSIQSNVKSISLDTQVLIVLMKLKLNLCNIDLAHRFQTSPDTIHTICILAIPFLEAKLDLVLKSPINNALKNIPVCFKNTENLYQTLHRDSKSKAKQSRQGDIDLGMM